MPHTLQTEHNVSWLPLPNECSTVLDDCLPPLPLITTALAIAFDGPHLLMTHLRHRGWDIPGGHLEPQETPEQALHREVWEETRAALANLRLLGYQHMRVRGTLPAHYRYPLPDSYQVFYLAQIHTFEPFEPTEEVCDRALWTAAHAQSLRWVQHNRLLYEAALQVAIAENWTSQNWMDVIVDP